MKRLRSSSFGLSPLLLRLLACSVALGVPLAKAAAELGIGAADAKRLVKDRGFRDLLVSARRLAAEPREDRLRRWNERALEAGDRALAGGDRRFEPYREQIEAYRQRKAACRPAEDRPSPDDPTQGTTEAAAPDDDKPNDAVNDITCPAGQARRRHPAAMRPSGVVCLKTALFRHEPVRLAPLPASVARLRRVPRIHCETGQAAPSGFLRPTGHLPNHRRSASHKPAGLTGGFFDRPEGALAM